MSLQKQLDRCLGEFCLNPKNYTFYWDGKDCLDLKEILQYLRDSLFLPYPLDEVWGHDVYWPREDEHKYDKKCSVDIKNWTGFIPRYEETYEDNKNYEFIFTVQRGKEIAVSNVGKYQFPVTIEGYGLSGCSPSPKTEGYSSNV